MSSSLGMDLLADRAFELGREHGMSAGTWVIDGNTSEETARWWLRGLEDGDPEVEDQLPSAPLSGEWAGDPLPADVLASLDLDEDDVRADDLLSAFEDGYYTGAHEQVEWAARAVLGLNTPRPTYITTSWMNRPGYLSVDRLNVNRSGYDQVTVLHYDSRTMRVTWMRDWDTVQELLAAGILREVCYGPATYNHSDVFLVEA